MGYLGFWKRFHSAVCGMICYVNPSASLISVKSYSENFRPGKYYLSRFLIIFLTPVLCLSFFFSGTAHSRQKGLVVTDSLNVYEKPYVESPIIGVIVDGQKLSISNETVKDATGVSWRKVEIKKGIMGYARSEGIRSQDLTQDLIESGVSVGDKQDNVAHDLIPMGWMFVLRVMGVAGLELAPRSSFFLHGGEVEGLVNIPFTGRGHFSRFFALGPSIVLLNQEPMGFMTLLFRFFNRHHLYEPEFRLRIGSRINSGFLFAGGNVGMRFPFSLNYRLTLAGYLELAGVYGLTGLTQGQLQTWFSAGIGVHF